MLNSLPDRTDVNIRKDFANEPTNFREIDEIHLSKQEQKELMKIYKENQDKKNEHLGWKSSNQNNNNNNNNYNQEAQRFMQKTNDLFSALDKAEKQLQQNKNDLQEEQAKCFMFQDLDRELTNQQIKMKYQSEKDREEIEYQNQKFTKYNLKDIEYDEKTVLSNAFAFLQDLEKKRLQQEQMLQAQNKLEAMDIQEQTQEQKSVQDLEEEFDESVKIDENFDKDNFKPKFNSLISKNKIQNEEKKKRNNELKNKQNLLSMSVDEDEDEEF